MKAVQKIGLMALGICLVLVGCNIEGEQHDIVRAHFDYRGFVKKFHRYTPQELQNDTANVLDHDEINPFEDSLTAILQTIEASWLHDSMLLLKNNRLIGILHADSATLQKLLQDTYDSTSEINAEASIVPVEEDAEHLKFNLASVRAMDQHKNSATGCSMQQCRVWARVNKQRQRLLLYVDGQLVDSFKVSTGDAKHETPNMSVRAAGPIFKKYTSKKFPGGDYMGLGNMPYAVFFRGGFAIHGTTPGNFSKLGKPASHGCIRLHPDDAVIFNELVRTVGLSETWVTVE